MHSRLAGLLFSLAISITPGGAAQAAGSAITSAQIDAAAKAIEPKTIEWRRDFHTHPELSNREVRTAEQIAKRLRALGLEVQTGVGLNGVVGLLRGGQPGRTVGLRADMPTACCCSISRWNASARRSAGSSVSRTCR